MACGKGLTCAPERTPRAWAGLNRSQAETHGGIMTIFVCRTCAVEQPDTGEPAAVCAICSDERQYVRPTGQQWTTLEELRLAGRRGAVSEVEPGMYGITIEPTVGIGQRALLVQTPSGNLLWDPNAYLDDALIGTVRR